MKIERIGEEVPDDKAIPWTASTSERSKITSKFDR